MVLNLFSQNSNIFGLYVVRKGSRKIWKLEYFKLESQKMESFRLSWKVPSESIAKVALSDFNWPFQLRLVVYKSIGYLDITNFSIFQLPFAITCKPNRAFKSVSGSGGPHIPVSDPNFDFRDLQQAGQQQIKMARPVVSILVMKTAIGFQNGESTVWVITVTNVSVITVPIKVRSKLCDLWPTEFVWLLTNQISAIRLIDKSSYLG